MPPSLADRLQHILDAIAQIEKATATRSYSDFANDPLLGAAIERFFEKISEASRYIPEEEKAREPDIAWQRMADLGNWLRHAYHNVDAEILWKIVRNDLPKLKAFVERVMENGDSH